MILTSLLLLHWGCLSQSLSLSLLLRTSDDSPKPNDLVQSQALKSILSESSELNALLLGILSLLSLVYYTSQLQSSLYRLD